MGYASVFRSETLGLAEALRHLFHALLLHENGLPADILLKAMTQSVLAERSILPSLKNDNIGFEITYSFKRIIKFRPDYLLRLTNGKTLILEAKG